jgi:hypothetical protein
MTHVGFSVREAHALESVSNRFSPCLENSVGQLGIVESAASWSSITAENIICANYGIVEYYYVYKMIHGKAVAAPGNFNMVFI